MGNQVDETQVLPTLPAPYCNTRPRRRARSRQLLSFLVLISAVLTLLTVLPTPWSLLRPFSASRVAIHSGQSDPVAEWKDDVYPLRPPTPWDISTDYSYPRKLEYDVQEGTFLRLDVHPISGDIVFDMVGDLYCLPGAQAFHLSDKAISARPVLLGIPHDSDPHFSPTGDRLVFRSDAELGVENIWVMEWRGCDEMNLKATNSKEELRIALSNKELDEKLLVHGVKEDVTRKRQRLIREGRINAQRVTNETYRWVSDARFHPSGSKVIATKWYTSDRSLGAGEGWEYAVPSVQDLRSQQFSEIDVGSGNRIISRSLPLGRSAENYGDQQIGPEQLIWKGGDSIIYSKNVVDEYFFTFNKDVHRGTYAIFERNLTTGSTNVIVDSFPGGATRPELSRDGKTLAFVRRVRDKEALVLKDLETGTIHNVWYGLMYDLSGVYAPMGTYPSFSFTPKDDAVVIWAAGQIYSVPLTINYRGEKVASSTAPSPITFTAHIEKRLAETRKGGADVVGYETRDSQHVRAFKELRIDSTGTRVVFQAGGLSYWQKVGAKEADKVPVTDDNAAYYSPSFVPFQNDLVVHARWSDSAYTKFELADLKGGKAYEIGGLPLGRYFSPVFCVSKGSKRTIAFLKSGGSYLTGNVLAIAGAGLYVGEVTLPESFSGDQHAIKVEKLRFVPSEINTEDRVNMRFLDTNKQLLVQQSNRAFVIDLSGKTDQLGRYPHITLAAGKSSQELVISSKPAKTGHFAVANVAFVDFFQIYLASGDNISNGETVWSKPANSTKGLIRLSLDGGHDVNWSPDGKTLLWFLGPYLHSLKVSEPKKCASDIEHDRSTFGIDCVKSLLDFQMVVVEHETDIARLKKQAAEAAYVHKGRLDTGKSDDSDHFLVYNATLLTMETGSEGLDLIRNGSMLISGGVIQRIGPGHLFDTLNPGIQSLDAHGGFVIPGFVDIHAHWVGFSDRYPAKSWEMETFLAYGVTTLHNPSADTVDGFSERIRIERGLMVGPRIFTVGNAIYGAGLTVLHQDIADLEEAKSALIRIKAEGGPTSISYKNYNLPSRASRQMLLSVAQNLSMLCMPEGGSNYDWDLTYIIDGMTTIEHAIPVPTLYDDVLTLYALSGTGATPTHIVNYGGVWGEQLVWASNDIPNDPKSRRFTRHDILEGLTESTARPASSFALFNTSRSIAAMVDQGLLANIGSHGEPPLGLTYHAEMGFTGKGGLSNYEVIRAATSSGAKTLGMFPSLGSLSPGKLADFLIYPPGFDLLEGEVSAKTLQLRFVARGGRIWDAQTMVEFWPVNGAKQNMPVINAD
ncbi:hypothetical protein HYPSUDRAFT_47891 [Hypholoma sublateritium FD-334 SS-4]|uniref:Amidohydrolase-related domain-containing protein n=1 Tax=Hypholoma sublateritium (strain FD-334 SS-4) TaxID=945553 RepID=A0A0D2NGY6_HYPSF|nr:hypothetical protein HYPSUDRAFT_47891 [Hypholoma sublateritium FD-334 SS-4]